MASAAFYATAKRVVAARDAGVPYAILMAETGWTYTTLRSVASKMRHGRIAKPGARTGRRWTPIMDHLLLELWETRNAKTIAGLISTKWRTVNADAVNARAKRLGLSKPDAIRNGGSNQWRQAA